MGYFEITTIVLIFFVLLIVALFIVYAVTNERRFLNLQSDFDERIETQHQLYDERLEKREKRIKEMTEEFNKERAQYVLEMLAVYKEKNEEEFYQKSIKLNLDNDKHTKVIQETEEEEPEYIR